MNIYSSLSAFQNSDRYNTVMQRSQETYSHLMPKMTELLNKVRSQGDQAIIDYHTKEFGLTNFSLTVSPEEIKEAYTKVDEDFLTAAKQIMENVSAVHIAQKESYKADRTKLADGEIEVWREYRPVEKVGLYVPGGKAAYPSTVFMTVIPAKVAGCKDIVICTPPGPDGKAAPSVLVALDMLGITQIYKAGGPWGIAAMSIGTETVPKVYKVFGPGNSYVAATKLLCFAEGLVNIDSPAGPSEVMIIADETANARFVAADLIADCEHGDDSTGVLLTTSATLAEQVNQEIENLLTNIPTTADRARDSFANYGAIIVIKDIDEAIDLANDYAAEHLQIMTENGEKVAKKIINAGSVFIGDYTCKSSGDYTTGANHVLPTGQGAKMFGALGTMDFMKSVEFQKASKKGLASIRFATETFANEEGLPGHAQSCSIRFE